MTSSIPQPQADAPLRYYAQDSSVDKRAPTMAIAAALHLAYTHWVRANCHRRDFRCAAEHVADMLMVNYFMAAQVPAGLPEYLALLPQTPRTPVELASLARNRPAEPAKRFYDELCAIAPEVSLDALEAVLPPLFKQWCLEGWVARDFVCAVRDAAAVVIYDHEIAQSFAGLGGGRTESEFLTQPYKG